MAVKRIVANLKAERTKDASVFYEDVLGLKAVMDFGWIVTYACDETTSAQISIATEGGSGTEVPDLSIEVDNIDDVYELMKTAGFEILLKITDEPWGVRRFYVRDPFEKVVNILSHTTS